MQAFANAAALLPPELRGAFLSMPEAVRAGGEELRLRTGFAPSVRLADGERPLPFRAVTEHDLQCVLTCATGGSVHTAADSIRNGFVTARGGVRVGLCGVASVQDGAVCGIRRLTSVCIRVPRAVPGCAGMVLPALLEGGFADTLLLSPPGAGKTTLLREIVRGLSERGVRVALADERGEVAGVCDGVPQFDVGPCTDVLTGAPKGEGALLLLRAMSPQVLAMDEITAEADLAAASAAANCGVRLLATAHAGGLEELCRRRACRRMLEAGMFQRAVVISVREGRRCYAVLSL